MTVDLTEAILPDAPLPWQMTRCERFALAATLQKLQPRLSLEIGTYRGGSLQVLSQYSQEVISVDIDPKVAETLQGRFSNVRFECGNSGDVLPRVVDEINTTGRTLEFLLIDGDHSSEGVRRDINAILRLMPKARLVVMLHDSFNPACRDGMRRADWARNPFVHYVELDFILGIYHAKAFDTAEAKSMWGGLACAVMEPFARCDELVIGESQRELFEAVLPVSRHCRPAESAASSSFWRRSGRRIKSWFR
jgi:hypothetical protein